MTSPDAPRPLTVREALEKYGEHQHEWVAYPTQRFENGAWRDAREPEVGWDRRGVRRICPDDTTGECWCGLDAALSPAPSADAGGEPLTRDEWVAREEVSERWSTRYRHTAVALRLALGSIRSLKLPDWLGKQVETAWQDSAYLVDITAPTPALSAPSDPPTDPDLRADIGYLLDAVDHLTDHVVEAKFYCEDTDNVQHFAAKVRAALRAGSSEGPDPRSETLDEERLARALNASVGTDGWLHTTPSDPVEEWRENARIIAAEYRRLSHSTGELTNQDAHS